MPPEPNPDGSYNFSLDEIEVLNQSLEALKSHAITHNARLHFIEEAQAILPTEQQQHEHADKFEAIAQRGRHRASALAPT